MPFSGGGIFWGLGSGVSCFAAVAGYYYLMFRKDASDIVIFTSLTPAITLGLSFMFLGESISSVQFLGFWLVLAAVLLVTLHGFRIGRDLSTLAVVLMMDMCLALSSIFIKVAMDSESFALSLAYEGWGLGIAGIAAALLFPEMRRAFSKNLAAMPSVAFAIIGFNELLTVAAKWVGFFAFSIGPVALVSVVGGVQVFYAIIIGYLLAVFAPVIATEDISKGSIVKKIAAIILVVGLRLIYI